MTYTALKLLFLKFYQEQLWFLLAVATIRKVPAASGEHLPSEIEFLYVDNMELQGEFKSNILNANVFEHVSRWIWLPSTFHLIYS